jgi:hypothetical protein
MQGHNAAVGQESSKNSSWSNTREKEILVEVSVTVVVDRSKNRNNRSTRLAPNTPQSTRKKQPTKVKVAGTFHMLFRWNFCKSLDADGTAERACYFCPL